MKIISFVLLLGPGAFDLLMSNARLLGQPSLPSLNTEPKNRKQTLHEMISSPFYQIGASNGVVSKSTLLEKLSFRHPLIASGLLMGNMMFSNRETFISPPVFTLLLVIINQNCRNIVNVPERTCLPHHFKHVVNLYLAVFRVLPYLTQSSSTLSCLLPFELKLQEKELYEYVLVEDSCPSEPRRKYEYLQKLMKRVLSLNTCLTYLFSWYQFGEPSFAMESSWVN